jgi:hypothetical protein
LEVHENNPIYAQVIHCIVHGYQATLRAKEVRIDILRLQDWQGQNLEANAPRAAGVGGDLLVLCVHAHQYSVDAVNGVRIWR